MTAPVLTNAERETCISQTADDHDTWLVYTDDPMWIARLDKFAVHYKESFGGGRFYKLEKSQIQVRAKAKPLSDAEKERRALVLAKALESP